jgi:hypothetical protein
MAMFSFLFRKKSSEPADPRQQLERKILRRTGNRIRNLKVEAAHGTVTISGEVPSRYVWQLVLAAAAGGFRSLGRLEMHVNIVPQSRSDPAQPTMG